MINAVHVHLLLVHLPVVLTPTATVILATTRCGRNDAVLKIAAWILTASAASALGSYFSGGPSFELLESELEAAQVDAHASAAQIAMIAAVLVGGLALKALFGFWQDEPPGRGLRVALLPLAVVASWLLARAAHVGGTLRHPESAGPPWLEALLLL